MTLCVVYVGASPMWTLSASRTSGYQAQLIRLYWSGPHKKAACCLPTMSPPVGCPLIV